MSDLSAPAGPGPATGGKRTDRLLGLLIFVVASLFGYNYCGYRLGDPDMFWHIATGKWIVEHHAIPTTDVFSWWGIANHRPWVPQGWLFDVGAYFAHNIAGSVWVSLFIVVGLLEGVLALLLFRFLKLRGLSSVWALAFTFVALLGTKDYVVPRPQIVTYCLLLGVMILLEKKKFWWALPLITIGVNVHGGMWPVYFAVMVLYAWPKDWKFIGAALVACAINPQPIGTFAYPFLAYSTTSTQAINEYTPTALWTLGVGFWIYLSVFVLVVLRRVKIPLLEGLFALGFVVLGLTGIRHVVWMYVLVIPVLAKYLAPTAESLAREGLDKFNEWRAARGPSPAEPSKWGEAAWSGADESAPPATATGETAAEPESVSAAEPAPAPAVSSPAPRRLRLAIEPVIVLVLVVAAIAFLYADVLLRYDPTEYYPVAMAKYLIDHHIENAYTSYNDGGFLIYAGYHPMLDGRFDPFVAHYPGDLDLMSDYLAVGDFNLDIGVFLRKYHITYLMIPKGQLAIAIQHYPGFVPVAGTNTHTLFRYDQKLDPSAPGYVKPSTAGSTGGSAAATASSSAPATP
jgi:hypothetical protein